MSYTNSSTNEQFISITYFHILVSQHKNYFLNSPYSEDNLQYFMPTTQGRPSRECQRALAPLVFWSRSLKKSRKVSRSKSRSSKWHHSFYLRWAPLQLLNEKTITFWRQLPSQIFNILIVINDHIHMNHKYQVDLFFQLFVYILQPFQ